jgi:predicted adenylyl cyclase CyaB
MIPTEVELKFKINDPERIINFKEKDRGMLFRSQEITDQYYQRPEQPSSESDMWFRLRYVKRNWGADRHYFTYKGPRHESGRPELEFDIGDNAEAFEEMMKVLGLEPFVKVEKTRRSGQTIINGLIVTVDVDKVTDLGDFVELEIVLNKRREGEHTKAVETLWQLAEKLGLTKGHLVEKGYAKMLVE